MAGWIRAGNGDAAFADWERVKAELRTLPDADSGQVQQKARLLLDEPPRRQVYIADRPEWRTAGPSGDMWSDLVEAIKRVRNNLFHGGKFGSKLRPRLLALIAASKATLEQILASPPFADVAAAFYQFHEERW